MTQQGQSRWLTALFWSITRSFFPPESSQRFLVLLYFAHVTEVTVTFKPFPAALWCLSPFYTNISVLRTFTDRKHFWQTLNVYFDFFFLAWFMSHLLTWRFMIYKAASHPGATQRLWLDYVVGSFDSFVKIDRGVKMKLLNLFVFTIYRFKV